MTPVSKYNLVLKVAYSRKVFSKHQLHPQFLFNFSANFYPSQSKAQDRNPNFTPANVHKVTVPGPIKAAAIRAPGPVFFNENLLI